MSERDFAEIVYRALKMVLLALEKRYAFGGVAHVVQLQPTDSVSGSRMQP